MTDPSIDIRELLDVAVELTQAAGDHTLRYYGHLVDYDAKGDGPALSGPWHPG